MKKFIIAIISIMLLCGCASGTYNSNISTSETTSTPVTSTVTSIETSAVTSYESSNTSSVPTASDEEGVASKSEVFFEYDVLKERLPWLTNDIIDFMEKSIIDSIVSYNPGPWGDYYLTLADITGDGIPEFFHGPLVLSQVSDIDYQIVDLKNLKPFICNAYNEISGNYNVFIYHYASSEIFGGKYYLDSEGERFYTILSIYNFEEMYAKVDCLYYDNNTILIKQKYMDNLGESEDLIFSTQALKRKKLTDVGNTYIRENVLRCLYEFGEKS